MYKGVPYPIIKNIQGYFRTATNVETIKSSILTIILTRPGERVMEPEFGIAFDRITKNNVAIIEQTRIMVAKAIARWEPRIQVADVKAAIINEEYLQITVEFIDPTNLAKTEEIIVEISI